jgi:arylsulfatase A-like enzyme
MRCLVWFFSSALLCVAPLFAGGFEIVRAEKGSRLNSKAGGATLIEKGNSKGQTFRVKDEATLKSITLRARECTAAKDLMISFVEFQAGSPGETPFYIETKMLPSDLAGGDAFQLIFEKPLPLTAGNYAFLVSTRESKLKLSLGNVYDAGRLIRMNESTRGKWVPGGSGRSTDMVFELAGLPIVNQKENGGAPERQVPEVRETPAVQVMKRYENPRFSAGTLSRLTRAPNIITVMVDDLGWNQIGVPRATFSSNSADYKTPNLMRLADEGLCFTNAYAQPNCAPTRAAMLSGQYPARVHNDVYVVGSLNRYGRGGVSRENAKFVGPGQSEDVAVEAVTVAEALKANGYQTAHIGKYHVGGHDGSETLPENVGFDVNLGGYSQGHQPVCFASNSEKGGWVFRGLGRGHLDRFAEPYDEAYLKQNQFPLSLAGSPKHISDAVADAMEETVKSFSRQSSPFYVQVHPYAVHGPVRSRPDLQEASGNDAFYGFVRSVDSIVGRLLKVVEDPNGDGDQSDSIAGHTLILFTSDNGGTHKTNLPLKGTKGMFTEGGIRVPLIAWWPGMIPPRTVSNRLVHTVDYYPTYLQLSGGKWMPSADEHPLDGFSFAEALVNPVLNERGAPVFYMFPGYLDQRAQPCLAAIDRIDGTQYKMLYYFESDAWELYNITEDIGESNNLASDNPEIASRLADELSDWLSQEHPTWKPKYPLVKSTGKPAEFPTR